MPRHSGAASPPDSVAIIKCPTSRVSLSRVRLFLWISESVFLYGVSLDSKITVEALPLSLSLSGGSLAALALEALALSLEGPGL